MKRIWLILVIAIGFTACNTKEEKGKFTVKGTIKNVPDQKVYLEQLFFSEQPPEVLDTGEIKNGKFTVSALATEEGFYRLRLQNKETGFLFINDENDIVFTGDGNDMTLKGASFNTPANHTFAAYLEGIDKRRGDFEKTANRIKELELHADNDSALTAEKKQIASIEKEANDYIIKTIDTTKSPVVALLALGSSQSIDTSILNKTVTDLEKRFPDHKGVADVMIRFKKMQAEQQTKTSTTNPSNKTGVGSAAPDFTMNDADGKPFSLSQLKGKYVLVDFWASWCGPCRGENPNVVAAYHQFKDKNFTILGVSLDDDKAAWLKAIKDDKLEWKQVTDLKGWQNETVTKYGYDGIPYNVLIDPQGKIIATELRGPALESKLAEVLK